MTTSSVARRIIIALTVVAGAACVGSIADPSLKSVSASREQAGSGATLVECPTSETLSASALVTSLGGEISVGGTTVTIPAGALLVPTTVTLTIPASSYMEIDVSAAGPEDLTFALPISIALGYGRCTRSDIEKSALTVWYISLTYELLEFMGGIDDKMARTVTFTTDHLSGYALAN